MIWSHIVCLRLCMNVRSHRLQYTRIQSSRRREIGGWLLLISFSLLFFLLSLLSTIGDLHWTFRWTSHVTPIAIGAFDNIRTVSIVFVTFSALIAFRLVWTLDCFVTKLLTAKASIDSSKWLVSNSGISNAVDRNVRALEDHLNIVIRSKINANPVDRLSVAKDSCHLNSRPISLSDQRSYRIDMPFARNTIDHNRIGRWNSTRESHFEWQSADRSWLWAALE